MYLIECKLPPSKLYTTNHDWRMMQHHHSLGTFPGTLTKKLTNKPDFTVSSDSSVQEIGKYISMFVGINSKCLLACNAQIDIDTRLFLLTSINTQKM